MPNFTQQWKKFILRKQHQLQLHQNICNTRDEHCFAIRRQAVSEIRIQALCLREASAIAFAQLLIEELNSGMP